MKILLIAHHSMTDGMAQMANAAWEGACDESGIDLRLLRARDVHAEDVLGADGYIFARPEKLASMAGITKDPFDRTHCDALDRIDGRAYATLICAGSDGTNGVRQIDRICTGWRLKRIAEPLIVCARADARGHPRHENDRTRKPRTLS